jgi:hypothetical protein
MKFKAACLRKAVQRQAKVKIPLRDAGLHGS